jgi:glycosyltransferase involved in cell wall biosynthesis
MTTSRQYTLITPRADRTGPTNLAIEIGRAAAAAGWNVRLLYLSGRCSRRDVTTFAEVRRWRLGDLWQKNGVVHTHGLRPDLVGWLYTWTRRCTVMSTLHGHFPHHLSFDYPWWKVCLAWGVWSRALKRFDFRVCISRTMQRHYARILPEQRFDMAYNFRSEQAAALEPLKREHTEWISRQRAAGRTVLVYVGSLTTRKNVLALVRHVAECGDLALLLCGEGPLSDTIASIVRERSTDSILMAGHLDQPERAIAMSDVLVLPSLAEGLPLVVLEAARMGAPSLLSNIAVHRELSEAGLGDTFDRHRFSDFAAKAVAMAARRSTEHDGALRAVWQRRFSPAEGFAWYERLVRTSAASE